MSNGLRFDALRGANTARLPQFKNSRGGQAHAQPDGSDWNPAQWLQAVMGELGEFARVRLAYEAGLMDFDSYCAMAAKELADVQTYLDILARRALDKVEAPNWYVTPPEERDPATNLMLTIALLGEYANDRKKFERGDIDRADFEHRRHQLANLYPNIDAIANAGLQHDQPMPVVDAHPIGVDLGRAVIGKFNEVSERVGSTVRLAADDWHYTRT
ncbi:MAG TPA: MazG-like family protein [Ramlibacter sp.]|nr:MazG-like family protein [Ramlibacter sp.]